MLAVDAVLKFPMVAAGVYALRGKLFWDCSATADFKWRHTGPASPTSVRIYRYTVGPAAGALGNLLTDAAYSAADLAVATAAGTTGGYATFEGCIVNGVNAGDFAISWAQNTSDVGATTLLAGSYLEYMRMA